MIYLNFSDLSEEAKDRLLESSKQDVRRKFGGDIERYFKRHNTDFEILIEEEAVRNLYTLSYTFKV
jgi:hypothetical protein